MKLPAYLTMINKGIPEAAKELDRSPETVRCWCKGQRIPRAEDMVLIFKWSGGLVTPNDFYDLPELPSSVPADEGDDLDELLNSPRSTKERGIRGPLNIHKIRSASACEAGNGHAMPEQGDLYIHAEARS